MDVLRLLVFLLLAFPGAASASSVFYAPPYTDPPGTQPEESCSRYAACPPSMLAISGEPGEANRFTVTIEATEVVVSDAGAPLRAGSGCRREGDGAVRCPLAEVMSLRAGDGDDEARVGAGWRGTVAGEAGNDVLAGGTVMDGGAGDDVVTGTPGADTLVGGAGADRVTAGEGDDSVAEEPGSPAGDVLDGGPGVDLLTFTGRHAPVSADLGPQDQTAGSPGEGNVVGGFELVGGGNGDDVLRMHTGAAADRMTSLDAGRGDDVVAADLPVDLLGGPGADTLSAGPGRDRLFGGDGPDRLSGGAGGDILEDGYDGAADVLDGGAGADDLTANAGRDRLLGRAGNDRITSRDRRRDRVDCGTGRDRLTADRRDARRGCEEVRLPHR